MTDQLDDVVRDALRAEVSGVQAPDDGPRRLHAHLQRGARRQRVARVAVVAAAIAVVAIASLALVQDGHDDSPVIADEPTTTTGEVTTTTLPDAEGAAVDPRDVRGPRPEQIVATTDDGRLVVLDVTTGNEVRELARAGVASDYQHAGSEPFIDAVEVSSDGSTAYYSTCCEPAPGAMYRVPLDGSEGPVRLALDGAYPDLRPGAGAQIAVANTIGVYVYDLPVGTLEDPTGSRGRELAEASGNAAQPFWLGPTSLAFQRFDPNEGSSIAVVSDIETESPTVTDLSTEGRGWEHPVGTGAAIIVAEQCCAPEYADTVTGRVVDPSSGEVLDSFELRGPVADLDLSSNWLLITYTDGQLDAVDLGADTLTPEPLASGLANAAWVPPAATGGSTIFSDCPERPSGSSPATFDPTAGTYAAQTLAVEEGSRLRFDIVQWLSGEDANEAYFQQTGDASGAPNDYFIRNDSTEVRTAPVADDADIYVLRADGYADSLHPVASTEIPTDDPDRTFWLTFEDGSITRICQQYRP